MLEKFIKWKNFYYRVKINSQKEECFISSAKSFSSISSYIFHFNWKKVSFNFSEKFYVLQRKPHQWFSLMEISLSEDAVNKLNFSFLFFGGCWEVLEAFFLKKFLAGKSRKFKIQNPSFQLPTSTHKPSIIYRHLQIFTLYLCFLFNFHSNYTIFFLDKFDIWAWYSAALFIKWFFQQNSKKEK
jgi:hypothetical protein